MNPIDPLGADPGRLRAEGAAVERGRGSLLGAISLYAPVAYVGALIVRDGRVGTAGTRLLLGVAPLALLRLLAPAIDDLPEEPRRLSRATVAALAVALLPWLTRVEPRWVVAASSAAGAVAGALATRLLRSITGLGGLGASGPDRAELGPNLVVVAFLLGGAQAIVQTFAPSSRLGSLQTELGLVAAIVVGAVLLIGRGVSRARLELGARERYDLALLATPLAFSTALALVSAAALTVPSAAAGVGVSVALGTLIAVLVRDPIVAFARVAAGWALLVLGAVAVEALTLVTPAYRGHVGVALGVGLGLSALSAARLLLGRPPAIAALAAAEAAAHATDERDLARAVLRGLRTLSGPPGSVASSAGRSVTPRLLLVSPLREITLDAAGEPRTRAPRDAADDDPDAPSEIARVVPSALLELLSREPLGVLRAEVLRAREVRGTELRVALAWCEAHDAAAVVAASEGGDLEGLLVLPEGLETRHLGLREARVLRAIADAVTARVALSAALVRARARAEHRDRHARDLETLLDRAQERATRAEHALSAASAPLAEPLSVGGYAPGARAALETLDRLALETTTHLVLVHAEGADPLPWAARLHARSGRAGALHVVDAATMDFGAARLSSSPSAVELADRGTLMILASHRLAPAAIEAVSRAVLFREGRTGETVDVRLVLAVPSPGAALTSAALTAWPEPVRARLQEVRIPPLAERTEDLRALALDRLGRLGLSLRGEPLGLTEEAFAALVEQPWPGDEAQLRAALLAAAVTATGPRIQGDDVRKVVSGAGRG